ncbi:MAG: SDR family oxidoreductase [Thermoleophilia bacterium]|jgi:meso-butanediol dehydrogenase/(S,S)-butanediol dehydrogenase/diacetyl reductase|nr:SDR family oxidoreductase [Thermoleophilia bacterium]
MKEPQRCAIVTGGGSGIGLAVSRRLAADGFGVLVTGRRSGVCEEAASELRAAGHAAASAPADVSEPDDTKRVAAEAIESFGGIDVLVCSAGIGDAAPVLDETLEGWERVMRTNLTGAFLMARAALPALIERRGSVVNISSVNGYRAGPGWAAYCTSKAGLIMLTRTIAGDYGPRGVRANCVCPGWIRTPMGDADMDGVARSHGTDREGAYDLTHRDNPLRRAGEADEIAGVVSFLAGPDAGYVNGVTLPVDGGTSIVDPTATAGQFKV